MFFGKINDLTGYLDYFTVAVFCQIDYKFLFIPFRHKLLTHTQICESIENAPFNLRLFHFFFLMKIAPIINGGYLLRSVLTEMITSFRPYHPCHHLEALAALEVLFPEFPSPRLLWLRADLKWMLHFQLQHELLWSDQ